MYICCFSTRTALMQLFRSGNRRKLVEVVLHIGASSMTPKAIYRIAIDVCDASDSNDEYCGANCSPLSDREVRRISSLMILNPPNLQFVTTTTLSPSHQKLFVYVRARRDIDLTDHFEEDDGYELPDDAQMQRRRIAIGHIHIGHVCELESKSGTNSFDADHTWLALNYALQGFE